MSDLNKTSKIATIVTAILSCIASVLGAILGVKIF